MQENVNGAFAFEGYVIEKEDPRAYHKGMLQEVLLEESPIPGSRNFPARLRVTFFGEDIGFLKGVGLRDKVRVAGVVRSRQAADGRWWPSVTARRLDMVSKAPDYVGKEQVPPQNGYYAQPAQPAQPSQPSQPSQNHFQF